MTTHGAAALFVTQRFVDSKTAANAIRDYALANNVDVKSAHTGGGRKKFLCSSASAGCSFFVYVVRTKATGESYWYISSLNLTHTNCASTGRPTEAQLVANATLQNAVAANPFVRAKTIASQLQAETSLAPPSLRTINRVITTLRQGLLGDVFRGHELLPSFLDMFVSLNRGSVACHEHDKVTGRFRRACLIPAGLAKAAVHGQAIFGIDGEHFKTDDYDGLLLLFVGRDGNGKNLTIGVALVPSESADNFCWFFEKLREAGIPMHWPIICDRAPGLIATVALLSLRLFHCSVHIYRNAVSAGFKTCHKDLFYELQGALTEDAYKSKLAVLAIVAGEKATKYVTDLDPSTWALYPHVNSLALFGWRSSNFIK